MRFRKTLFLLALLIVARPVAAQEFKLTGFDDYVRQALKDWEVPGLAIAIVSSIALLRFGSLLDAKVANLNAPQTVQTQMHEEASKLANAAPPPDLPDNMTAVLEEAVKMAYIETFRLISVIGAFMAWLSALLAFTLVGRDKKLEPVPASP